MSAVHTIECCWAQIDGTQAWQGYDTVIVTVASEARADVLSTRLTELLSRATAPPLIHVVVEGPEPLGKMAGTHAAWQHFVAAHGPSSRAVMVHDAGAALRSAPLALTEASRGAVQLPGGWGRSYGDEQELRLLDLVVVSVQAFATSCPGLDVFWGSQVVIPGRAPAKPTADVTRLAMPIGDRVGPHDLTDLGVHGVREGQPAGFLTAGTFDSPEALRAWAAAQGEAAWDLGAFRVASEALTGSDRLPDYTSLTVLDETSVWRRYRRPAELRAIAEELAGSTDAARVLRAAHRIEHPVQRCRLGDVFVDGPEVSWEDVRHGLEVGGVLIQRSIARHTTLLPGSALSDSVVEDSAGRIEAERSLVLGSEAESAVVQRGVLYKAVLDAPIGVSDDVVADVVRDPLGVTTVRAPLSGDGKEIDAETLHPGQPSFAVLRSLKPAPPRQRELDEAVPSPRLRHALQRANRESLVDLSLLASQEAARLATRELLARVVRDCERLTRSSRDSASRELGRIWATLLDHPLAAPVGAALREHGIDDADALVQRYERVRRNANTVVPDAPQRIVVLSRVTLGADIAITSVVLQRLQHHFPDSPITLVADRGCSALIGDAPGVRPYLLQYPRSGALAERVAAWSRVAQLVRSLGADLVVAPDSRLDQLGSLPVCPEEQYAFIETSFPGETQPWPEHVAAACDSLFGPGDVPTPKVWLDGAPAKLPATAIAVKLQAAGLRDKTLSRSFDEQLLKALLDRGFTLVVDRGVGDEVGRADATLRSLGVPVVHGIDDVMPALGPARVLAWQGSIGGWARLTAGCTRAIGYDSVHGHLAAALGLDTTVVFTGQPTDGFTTAWAPPGARVIDAQDRDEAAALAAVLEGVGEP